MRDGLMQLVEIIAVYFPSLHNTLYQTFANRPSGSRLRRFSANCRSICHMFWRLGSRQDEQALNANQVLEEVFELIPRAVSYVPIPSRLTPARAVKN